MSASFKCKPGQVDQAIFTYYALSDEVPYCVETWLAKVLLPGLEHNLKRGQRMAGYPWPSHLGW